MWFSLGPSGRGTWWEDRNPTSMPSWYRILQCDLIRQENCVLEEHTSVWHHETGEPHAAGARFSDIWSCAGLRTGSVLNFSQETTDAVILEMLLSNLAESLFIEWLQQPHTMSLKIVKCPVFLFCFGGWGSNSVLWVMIFYQSNSFLQQTYFWTA